MTNKINELDRMQLSLKELKIRLNSIYDQKSKLFGCTKVLNMNKEIDDIITAYLNIANSIEYDELSDIENSNLSPDMTLKDKSYYRFLMQNLRYDVEEVCILITFLLYGLKDYGSITSEEYREYTYYKKLIFERNQQQTIKDLIVFLEL